MTKAALNYIQIPAIDLEESITFYEEVLGWKVKRNPTVGVVVDQNAYRSSPTRPAMLVEPSSSVGAHHANQA